jgi:hypothetical protein
MKILHIHTDPKFIIDSQNFDFENFENLVVFVNIKKSLNIKSVFPIVEIENNFKAISKIKKLCENMDLLVIYDLDPFKIALINSLDLKIKIIWRFFGHELYSKNKEKYYSESTIKHSISFKTSFFNRIITSFNYRFNLIIKTYILKNDYEINAAIIRTNFFMGLFKEEYDELKLLFEVLPTFLQVPLFNKKIQLEKEIINKKLKNQILIGNSRNNYNNHLDILNISKKFPNYKYILPFSYGYESKYSEKVKMEANNCGSIVLNQFLNYDEYQDLYNSSDCLVINAYRQMAVGNIMIGLQKGLKIYLNEKNIVFKILLENDFIISNVLDLENDFINNNICLSKEEMIHNINSYNSMNDKYSLKDFKIQIDSILC